MKIPRPRGAALDNPRYRSWNETFSSYRHAINVNSIDRWLDQFDEVDKDLAVRILDCIEFVSNEQISSGFRQILSDLPGWNINEDQRIGNWRFVPFSGSAGKSGDSMTHKFRHANRMGGRRYDDLFIYRSDLIRERLTQDDTVVFIDDFSGTGTQACGFWTQMQELLPGDPNIYLALIGVTNKARQKISEETDLQIVSHINFDDTDNIFSENCTHFNQDEKAKLIEYCERADRRYPKGAGESGMVLVFAHNTPNNSIPILHTYHDVWEGLFRRSD